MYFKVDGRKVVSMLKVAVRKLYLRAEDGQMRDISPLCVLDFYVHESAQRRGQGKKLFDEMLKREGVLHPARLAYDKPSIKMMGFLAKHYNLRDYTSQSSNHIVFRQFWESQSPQRQ